ncbi:conserved hypothetical protein [Oenococcus oeni]|nr:conserved hypothetical protein [Oenococcus oeni]SYW08107.1 conserved hypothetical protein [Oenococcus oeni]SYW19620.1 conserved hypothetical protein [Oenococcus oeni]
MSYYLNFATLMTSNVLFGRKTYFEKNLYNFMVTNCYITSSLLKLVTHCLLII